jgi:putative flippase GtrA
MRAILALLSRFGTVGIAATLLYLIVSNILIFLGAEPIAASVVAYIAGMVVSFFGQSLFTFRVQGLKLHHGLRFFVLSAVGLLMSYGTVYAAMANEIPPMVGTVATALLVPVISFLAMRFWVFPDGSSGPTA